MEEIYCLYIEAWGAIFFFVLNLRQMISRQGFVLAL